MNAFDSERRTLSVDHIHGAALQIFEVKLHPEISF
jgi:hypothetical protein